jgi:hypothetical protein
VFFPVSLLNSFTTIMQRSTRFELCAAQAEVLLRSFYFARLRLQV